MKLSVCIALAASFALSAAAIAADKKPAKDPDRMICKTEYETGSRLAKKKRCMTAAQWEEQRRLSRMEIDRSQVNNYKNN